MQEIQEEKKTKKWGAFHFLFFYHFLSFFCYSFFVSRFVRFHSILLSDGLRVPPKVVIRIQVLRKNTTKMRISRSGGVVTVHLIDKEKQEDCQILIDEQDDEVLKWIVYRVCDCVYVLSITNVHIYKNHFLYKQSACLSICLSHSLSLSLHTHMCVYAACKRSILQK